MLRELLLALAVAIPISVPSSAADAPAAAGKGTWIMSLVNSDMVSCRIHKIEGDKIRLSLALGDKEEQITMELARVESMRVAEPPNPVATTARENLLLRDGSSFFGQFVKLTPTALLFDAEDIGQVAFPRETLAELRKVGDPAQNGPTASKTVVITAENTLCGALEQEPDGALRVNGEGVEARVAYSAVKAILFPGGAIEPKADEKPLRMMLSTVTGAVMMGRAPTIDDGRVGLTLNCDTRVTLPMDRVSQMSFSSGAGAVFQRTVLCWGRFSDRAEEFPRTVAALKQGLSGFQIIENFADTFDNDFRAALARSRTLVIPEMEQFNIDQTRAMELAAALKKVTMPFLQRGGNVVVLGTTAGIQCEFLKTAGLLDVQVNGSNNTLNVPFTAAGKRLAGTIGAQFLTTNSTQFYSLGPTLAAEAWAGTPQSAPVVGRRAGAGWIILMGMDYYESNDQTKKLLCNAATER